MVKISGDRVNLHNPFPSLGTKVRSVSFMMTKVIQLSVNCLKYMTVNSYLFCPNTIIPVDGRFIYNS